LLKILLADDNADQLLTLSVLLEGEGFDVRAASRAEDILPLAASFRPHVCLLDIGMPGRDGYATARELRAAYGAEQTLIAVTAYANERDRAKAREAGFDRHVAKPFATDELTDLIASLARERPAAA
jgi:CheY-like chemotaxis protein